MIASSIKRILLLTPLLLLAGIATILPETGHAQTGSGSTVSVHVRNGSQILYQGTVALSDTPLSIVDKEGIERSISGKSALAAIATVDKDSPAFHITDLVYYPSFSSFFINCIQAGTVLCSQWQYVVNDHYPFVGIDQVMLSAGDTVYLFFGQPNRLTPENPMLEVGKSFTALAEKYDYKTDSFSPRTGVTVGVTKVNPTDLFSPTVLSTAPVDGTGKATLTIATEGTYQLGISEDYYYPTVDVRVVSPTFGGGGGSPTAFVPATVPTPSPSPSPRPIGGLPDEGLTKRDPKATFLLKGQKETGEIENALVTDWAAIALGGKLTDAEKAKLQAYLIADDGGLSFTTDLERRAMALMALGVNPFSGTGTNYIVSIVRSFSNGQFGAEDLINDDIFGVIPVVRAGIVKGSHRVKKVVGHILDRQAADGSWENPDLTASAIQALLLADNDRRIPDAVRRGRDYLKRNQSADGRIGMNTFSSSWASQALTGTGSTLEDKAASEKARKYVESKVQADGGLKDGEDSTFNRLWGTAYALAAAEGKHWGDLLQPFSPRKK